MRSTLRILKTELKVFFYSPIAWLILLVFAVQVGAGLYGFDGIRRTAELMTEAWEKEKDPEDLIIRKGWGCESCI